MVTNDHGNSAIMKPAHSAHSKVVLWSKGGRSVTPASKLDIPKVIFDTFRFFLSSPPPKCLIIGSTSERILVTSILVFTIVITSSFQGNLVRFLSVPVYYPDIDNLKQLEKSPLLIWTSSLSWRDIFYSDPILWGLAKKVHRWKSEQDMHDSDGYYAGFQRINVHSYKYFKDVVLTGLKNNATRTLHTLSQNLITYYLAYIVIKDSPYRSRIDSLIGRMDQSGLVTKWSADVIKYTLETYRTVEDRRAKREKVFTVQDLSASFIVLGAGVCVASVVFLGEVLLQYWRYRKFKRVLVPDSKVPEDETFLQVQRNERKQDLAPRTGFEFLH
ncbi:ionotropic receptor 21a-like [Bemisia tabaci]|uniref:ionotropic receptor 21a-like n=1 Tax=Bemisia tabaci TaxID=7038 RepID=UPI003B28B279